MRLYEAMLKGARTGPQIQGTWANGESGTCAMGAVMVGCGLKAHGYGWYEDYQTIMEKYPELKTNSVCPAEGCHLHDKPLRLVDTIMHLNDFHMWSRQRIAEWLSGSRITESKPSSKVAVWG